MRVSLRSAFAPFLSIIYDRADYIISPTARAKFGKDYPRNPVGTGPFQFIEWIKDDHFTFKRFEGYFEPAVTGDIGPRVEKGYVEWKIKGR